MKKKILFVNFALLAALQLFQPTAEARDITYKDKEVTVNIIPGEPTQIKFPGAVKGGYKKQLSRLHVTPQGSDLVVFANEGLTERGEAIIVRLDDGRSYSIRIRAANKENPRDDIVKIEDKRESISSEEDELEEYNEKKFDYAPSSTVSGLVIEMILSAEFGKKTIPGYRVSDRYKGEAVLHDGTIKATIDRIYMGPNLWGYVLDAENLLDQTQQINPASFRIDGTRAISADHWEIAPRPLTIEQEVAKRHKAKIYIVTKAKGTR